MGKVRGIRFSDEEDALIEEFLLKNALIDFTTLAKMAILSFIRRPEVNLMPIDNSQKKERVDVTTSN